jgi:catechol 2,3-dioxygenase-like lactoylglutathione lyase family enzyme
MSRVQLALNVDDLEEAVGFYSKLFGVEPAKLRPGYANFAVEEPPLKLVLVEGRDRGGTINHLGIEVASTGEVAKATRRLADEGLPARTEDRVTCCYAVQDKVWVTAPGNEPWEVYVVKSDADTLTKPETSPCCTPATDERTAPACC